jgi:hypothetical protein
VQQLLAGVSLENTETAPAEAEAVSELSQHSVRHKGLEPLTFWLVVQDFYADDFRADVIDAEYQLLCAVEAVAL